MTTATRTMLEAKGAEYVAAWPANIARMLGTTPEQVLDAITGAGYYDLTPGDLTGEQARTVVAVVRRRVENAAPNACHYCGLPLNSRNECRECV